VLPKAHVIEVTALDKIESIASNREFALGHSFSRTGRERNQDPWMRR
jgi:hypothetical protein